MHSSSNTYLKVPNEPVLDNNYRVAISKFTAVNILSRRVSTLTTKDWTAVKRLMRY